uniref:Uncharacterized protein n=2 Tax=Lygus hesperus TaxID=30085 RepID=A0A146KSK3_LYGHE
MGKAWRTDHRTLVYIKEQEATPSRAVRSCRTAGLPSAPAAAQMSPGAGPEAARHRRILGSPVEPHSFYKSLRQEEAALDLDRLHVLKIRNREAEGGAMTKDKFSKYSPLPDISRPHGRPLLRQKTYDVLEPVYVKGPPSPRQATKPKDKPPPRTAERGKTATVSSRPKDSHAARDNHSVKDGHPAKDIPAIKDGHPAKESHPRKDSLAGKDNLIAAKDSTNPPSSNRRTTKLPHLPVQAPPSSNPAPPPPAAVPAKRPPLRRTSQFRPQELSKDILPQSPTAFWFPI